MFVLISKISKISASYWSKASHMIRNTSLVFVNITNMRNLIKLKIKRDSELVEFQPLYMQRFTKVILSKGSEDAHVKLVHPLELYNTLIQ